MHIEASIFRAATTNGGGITKWQFAALGITWPPVHGWRWKDYTPEQVQEFVMRKGQKGRTILDRSTHFQSDDPPGIDIEVNAWL